MKTCRVLLSSAPGLTLFTATRLATAVGQMQSVVLLKCGERVADTRNILSIVALCAVLGSSVEIQAYGDDAQSSADAVKKILSGGADSGPDKKH
ncbi:MAG: HPr family phosphocarrier protein [Chthoniobacterales bacterium]|nr:HPr family phosphocarrier protein [Chthoniobacterales bacterium]